MSIKLYVNANSDDALLAWIPDPWPESYVGFQLERRNNKTGQSVVINNRVPPGQGLGDVPAGGISSTTSPIRRCVWIDHEVDDSDNVSYRVTPMVAQGAGFATVAGDASPWTYPVVASGYAGDGLSAYFNRGTLMSQVVSRLVGGDVTVKSLKQLKANLASPGFPGRRYLAGDARHAMLGFLADADKRGSQIYAALYEVNDTELIAGLKSFGSRAHVLIGNGSSTGAETAHDLVAASVDVHHRDLSHSGKSSPSVHNKFVVEVESGAQTASRVLTGSTNWTVTGLCTQLNNVLIMERPVTAERFRNQWTTLVAAGDNMTDAIVRGNAQPTVDSAVTTFFAATHGEVEFKPVLDAIKSAKDGILFLMFMPGQSPLLKAILDRVLEKSPLYIRGVVSTVTESANGVVTQHDAQVVRAGVDPALFHDEVLLPGGAPKDNLPSWAKEEFDRRLYFPAGLNAIVHSKVIVIDPFSENCVVVTGSHNFSDGASRSNDENLVIIKGNKALALTYAIHIEGVHDHYAWRAFLSQGGDPSKIYKSLDGWKPGGDKNSELRFWARTTTTM